MSEPIYRTTYTLEVFSRGRLTVQGNDRDPFDLEAINYAITEGDCIGQVHWENEEVVPSDELEAHLVRIGNDGSFFEDDEWFWDDESGGES